MHAGRLSSWGTASHTVSRPSSSDSATGSTQTYSGGSGSGAGTDHAAANQAGLPKVAFMPEVLLRHVRERRRQLEMEALAAAGRGG